MFVCVCVGFKRGSREGVADPFLLLFQFLVEISLTADIGRGTVARRNAGGGGDDDFELSD